MKNKIFSELYYFIIALTIFLTSCSYYTKITYRLDKNDPYIREDGFIISCEKDNAGIGTVFYISTFTPDSWGKDFYYDYLKGKMSDKKLKIAVLNATFVETKDTIMPREIIEGKSYTYKSTTLEKIIDSNENLKLKISITDLISGKKEIKEYILNRNKDTYHTGTWPHVF